MGLKPDHVAWVPSNGAAPAMQDLAAGGLDIVTLLGARGAGDDRGGQGEKPCHHGRQRNPHIPDVPTLKEELGIDYSTGAWRGFAGPKNLPQDVQTKLIAALQEGLRVEGLQRLHDERAGSV